MLETDLFLLRWMLLCCSVRALVQPYPFQELFFDCSSTGNPMMHGVKSLEQSEAVGSSFDFKRLETDSILLSVHL